MRYFDATFFLFMPSGVELIDCKLRYPEKYLVKVLVYAKPCTLFSWGELT